MVDAAQPRPVTGLTMATDEPSAAEKRRRTQWATQFLAAAELTRRGYTVSFTTGNYTPMADLMVGAPDGELFWVDVKGLAKRPPKKKLRPNRPVRENDWLVKPKPVRESLFYILVLLSPTKREPDRFFILTQADTIDEVKDYRATHPHAKKALPTLEFNSIVKEGKYEDRWDKLPPFLNSN